MNFLQLKNIFGGLILIMVIKLRLHVEGARVMVVGSRGAANMNPRYLMLPEASIKGVALGLSTAEQYEMGCAIVAGIEAGWIKPVIDKEYSMAEVQQVHKDIIHSKGAKGKLVLKVADA